MSYQEANVGWVELAKLNNIIICHSLFVGFHFIQPNLQACTDMTGYLVENSQSPNPNNRVFPPIATILFDTVRSTHKRCK